MSSSSQAGAPPLPRLFWILWVGVLLNRLGDFVLFFLALYLSAGRGLAPSQVGLVVSVFGAGALAAGPIGGLLADRVGRRRTLLLALVLGALAMLHLGAARAIWHIALAAGLVGFLGNMYRPAQQAAIADLIEPSERQRAFAWMYWAVNLGFACAAVLGGFLSRVSFSLLFVIDAATTLGYAAVVFFFVAETRRPSGPREKPSVVRDLAFPFRDPVMLGFLGACLLSALVFTQISSTLPMEMGRHGIAPESFGRLIALNGVLIVSLQMGVVRLVRGRDPRKMMALSSLLIGVGFGSYAFAHGWQAYAAGIVVWTLGEMTQMPVVAAVIAELAPADRRGAYQGAFNLLFAAATCLAPILGGLALERLGSVWLWAGCFGLAASSALAHLWLGASERRRAANRPPAAQVA